MVVAAMLMAACGDDDEPVGPTVPSATDATEPQLTAFDPNAPGDTTAVSGSRVSSEDEKGEELISVPVSHGG